MRGILVALRADSRMSANEWHYRESSRVITNMHPYATHTNWDARDRTSV